MKRERDEQGRFLPVHGAYSKQKSRALRRYLTMVRNGLIADLGGHDNVSTAQGILIDGVINMLSITRAIEIFVRDKIISGDGLHPSLSTSYLAYRNSIQRHLSVLGIEIRDMPAPTLNEIIANIEKDKKK